MQKVASMARGRNADLWKEIYEEREARAGLFVVRQVWRSHVEGKDIAAQCISRGHAWGNAVADEMAKAGAQLHEVTPLALIEVEQIGKLAWQVLRRLEQLFSNILAADNNHDIEGTETKPERTTKTLSEKIGNLRKLGHHMQKEGGSWRCMSCRRSARGVSLTQWAEEAPTNCSRAFDHAAAQNKNRDEEPKEEQNMIIGRLAVHRSHKIFCKADIVFCEACGAWGKQRLVSLIQQCKHRPTTAGKNALKNIARGRAPIKKLMWTAAQKREQPVAVKRSRAEMEARSDREEGDELTQEISDEPLEATRQKDEEEDEAFAREIWGEDTFWS